jgi:hypothetical protein
MERLKSAMTARGAKQEITCACGCDRTRMVRTADVKRGWGKFFDKSCKGRGVGGFVPVKYAGDHLIERMELKERRRHVDVIHYCDDCGCTQVESDGGLCRDCYTDYDDDPSWDAHK